MKRISTAIILLIVCANLFKASAQGKKYAIRKVVIDAGHGGQDAGCLGSKSKEKDVALGISLKLGKLIEDNLSDVKVIYTRKTDVFVELFERAEIANNNKADLFICVHCNSACTINKKTKKEICNQDVVGTEIYALGLHKTEDNLKVAQRENASILMEENYQAKYQGFDPNSPEAYIIFSLYQNAFIDQSIDLSSKIQNQFDKNEGRTIRGVKQAGFLVLWRTTMPSILIETGFLTNKKEEQYLNSEEGQNKISTSIFNAFKEYKNEMESNNKGEKKESNKQLTVDNKQKEEAKDSLRLGADNKLIKKDSAITKTDTSPIIKNDSTKTISIPVDTIKTQEKKGPDTTATTTQHIVFSVQITSATVGKPIPLDSKTFQGIANINIDKSTEGVLKYIVGSLSNFGEAATLQNQLRERGFKDAFVVVYNNGKRISVQEAQTLLKK